MKPIIAVDFNGALLQDRPFATAHKKWFQVMATLLNDQTINEYAQIENYFPKVHEVTKRFFGNIPKETQSTFARQLYAMMTVAEVQKADVNQELVELLKQCKNTCRLALITSAPEACVEPILEKIGCKNLFDYVYKSPMKKEPNKAQLMKEFCAKYGKPKYYIGANSAEICNLGIQIITEKHEILTPKP